MKEWAGGDKNANLRRLENAFAISFFVLRILWMPYTWYGMNKYYPHDMKQLPRLLWCAYSAFVVLQFYWAFLIAKKVCKQAP